METHELRFTRADVERLLTAESPGADFKDDDIFYTQIVNDYEDYARLLQQEQANSDARKRRTDGVPFLGGGCGAAPSESKSIFDLAHS